MFRDQNYVQTVAVDTTNLAAANKPPKETAVRTRAMQAHKHAVSMPAGANTCTSKRLASLPLFSAPIVGGACWDCCAGQCAEHPTWPNRRCREACNPACP